jgi:hypothetical protein
LLAQQQQQQGLVRLQLLHSSSSCRGGWRSIWRHILPQQGQRQHRVLLLSLLLLLLLLRRRSMMTN